MGPSLRPTSIAALVSLSKPLVEKFYRPFIIPALDGAEPVATDWVDELELDLVSQMASQLQEPIKLLVLYGSLRERSFSRLTAYEASRILTRIGGDKIDVRVFDPVGLPMKDDRTVSEADEKVLELRSLCDWSDASFWCSPEVHGTITGVMKNQIDWIPLSVGSLRPTQGRVLAVSQISGGSQSFNTVNLLRQLGRWMRMWTIPNQSSIPLAWKCFTGENDLSLPPSGRNRLMPSSNRDRLVDVCEELVKATILLKPTRELLDSRYSERAEKAREGRLKTQAENEAEKDKAAANV